MPAMLRIDELAVVTPSNRFPYVFATGINTVVGEVGSGKSSLLELIKYALGGNGILTPAVQEGVRRVVLTAQIGSSRVVLDRGVGDRTVRALAIDGTPIEELAVGHTPKMRNVSSFLLGLLDLPELRVTNVKPTKKSQPLSFFDIYAYCYVPQAEIDRSIVNHLDNLTRAKRVGAFELLMGLTDDTVSAARVRLGQLKDAIAEASQPLATIDQFLKSASTPTEEELHRRRADAQQCLAEAESQLETLRSASLSATAQSAELRERLVATVRQARTVAERVQELEAAAAERRHLAAELASDLTRLDRADAAGGVLGDIAYVQCPRCFQALSPERFSSDLCYVCGQPDIVLEQRPDKVATSERQRIASLQSELRDLDEAGEKELDEVLVRHRTLGIVLSEIELELDRQTRDLVSPHYEALEAASAAAARARVELDEADRLLELWRQRGAYLERVESLKRDAAATSLDMEVAAERLASRRQRVTDLSEIFDEIIQELQMPWYEPGAHIDSKSYLPIVNGASIEDLGSGGMKMMTNVAYHLALLTYGLSEGLGTIPDLLILDSPRKNLGATDEDQAHAEAFYRWIAALTRAYEGRFQLIVADNDPPPAETPVAQSIELSHESPLVRDLEHPGGDVATIGV
jgi:hypothetical protein